MLAFSYRDKDWLFCKSFILDYYGSVCLSCSSTDQIHVDHIHPKSFFIRDSYNLCNLQPLCRTCNQSKMTAIIDYRKSDDAKDIIEALVDYREHNFIPEIVIRQTKEYVYRDQNFIDNVMRHKRKRRKIKYRKRNNSIYCYVEKKISPSTKRQIFIKFKQIEPINNKPKTILRKRSNA